MGILSNEEIGARLRDLRKRQGLTQEQLAEKIDVTFQQVQQYESGSSRLNADRLQAIAQALSVPVGSFFGEEETEATLTAEEKGLLQGYRRLKSQEVKAFVRKSLE
ncbi:helix-turn-helix domain-containing protein [Geobacter sp. FeAm09]|uniref:helix-turn-helix domain-containing protein n=1 Tax=Geobacter sp. FeAm09 TaxID=2597769 RepID=UPI00143DF6E5|nr:helix-turn-helix transcriptional regulator [Geobacter sp. FeAm09]